MLRMATRSPSLIASSMSWVTRTIVLSQPVLEASELVLEPGPDDRVDRPEWLVHQQDRRVGGQRPGHTDPLLLPAGQRGRVPRRAISRVEPDEVDQLVDARVDARLVPPEQLGDGGDVVGDGAVREEPDLLDDVADAPPQLVTGSSDVTLAARRPRSRPTVGSISRLIILSVVVLPHPDGPTSTAISPSAMSRVSSVTAGPSPLG